MALWTAESFDDALWESRFGVTGSPTVHTDYGLHGNGIRLGDITGTQLDAGHPTTGQFFIGFAFNMQQQTTQHAILTFGSAGDLRWTPGNELRLFIDGSVGGDYVLVSDALAMDEWHYIEVELKHGNTSDGTARMWIDDALVGGSDTVDYQNIFSGTIKFAGAGGSDIEEGWFDDIYICDDVVSGTEPTTRQGPLAYQVVLPDANGTTSDLVGQDADSTDNYLNVDEATPDDDTTYNESGTEGDLDTYGIAALSGTPDILFVVPSLWAIKLDAGAKYLRPVIRSGGTDYPGDSVALAESYSLLGEQAYGEDPDTATAWTASGVNSAEFGAEVRDS